MNSRITLGLLQTKIKNINSRLGREAVSLSGSAGCYNVYSVGKDGTMSNTISSGCSAFETSLVLDTLYWSVVNREFFNA